MSLGLLKLLGEREGGLGFGLLVLFRGGDLLIFSVDLLYSRDLDLFLSRSGLGFGLGDLLRW